MAGTAFIANIISFFSVSILSVTSLCACFCCRPVALNIHDLAPATHRSLASDESSPRGGDFLDMIPNIPNPLDLVKQIKRNFFRKDTDTIPAKQQEPVIPSTSSSDSDGPTTRPFTATTPRHRRRSNASDHEHMGSGDRWEPRIGSSESGLESPTKEKCGGVATTETVPTIGSFSSDNGTQQQKQSSVNGDAERSVPRPTPRPNRIYRRPMGNEYIDVENRRFLAYSRSDADSSNNS